MIFIATYEEWDKVFVNKETHEETTKRGFWRLVISTKRSAWRDLRRFLDYARSPDGDCAR